MEKTRHDVQIDGTPGAGHPNLAHFEGKLYLVWKGFDGQQTSLQMMTSSDAGASWSTPRALLSTAQASDHPLLISNDDGVYLSWHTEELGYQFMEISGDS